MGGSHITVPVVLVGLETIAKKVGCLQQASSCPFEILSCNRTLIRYIRNVNHTLLGYFIASVLEVHHLTN